MKCRRKVRGMDADGMGVYPPKIFSRKIWDVSEYGAYCHDCPPGSFGVLQSELGRPAAVPASVFLFRKDIT